MSAGLALATAVTFVWLGMVLAISFLEAPLKFRAPQVTVPIGLGIGRLVFRALNAAEAVLALGWLAGVAIDGPPARIVVGGVLAIVVLLAQVALVRPFLTRRTDLVLAGEDVPHSHGHLWYVGLEGAKVVALAVTGVLLVSL